MERFDSMKPRRRLRGDRFNSRSGFGWIFGFLLVIGLNGCGFQSKALKGEIYDAGPIFSDSMRSIERDFQVFNSTGKILKITNLTASCVCTTHSIDRREIKPGESANLRMAVNVPSTYSKHDIQCILTTDHPEFKRLDYAIRFESLPKMIVAPDSVNFGERKITGTITETSDENNSTLVKVLDIDVFCQDASHEIGGIKVQSPPFIDAIVTDQHDIRVLRNGIIDHRFQVRVKLNDKIPDESPGFHWDRITIAAGEYAKGFATIGWITTSDMVAEPAVIGFGKVDRSSKARTSIVMRSTLSKPFKIIAVDSDSPGLKILDRNDEFDRPTAEHRIELEFSAEEGIVETCFGKLRIKTDHDGRNEILVPWSAFIVNRGVRENHEPAVIPLTPNSQGER